MNANTQHISGADIRWWMRVTQVTIRRIAKHMGITLKRVRYVREHGIAGISCTDWMQAIRELAPQTDGSEVSA